LTVHAFKGPTLARGTVHADVALVKQRFNQLDRSKRFNADDPTFGSQLRRRVLWFQAHNGLDPDGKIGPATWARLFGLEPKDRAFPNVVLKTNVACQSARSSPITLIVLHSTEGQNVPGSAKDLQGLAAFFDRLSTQASSHVATDSDGQSARMVPDSRKAWTCAGYNSMSLNIEQIGFAAQGEWALAELKETARWIAYWHRHHGIPIRHSTSFGVCQHVDLGAAGGGHVDCGPGYPEEKVLELAEGYVVAQGG
jgi:N-acetylmuramoyl-L-alanine amidase/Putative peptidoglycan binding domain